MTRAFLTCCAALLLGLPPAASAAADAARYGLITESEHALRFAQEVEPLWARQVQRGHFDGKDGLRLAYAAVRVPGARAAVVIVSGRTENLLKYQEVVADLVRQRYSVYIHDHRGQGFSQRLLPDEPHKGHVVAFDDYVDDLQTFVEQVVRRDAPPLLLLLAHSMGGGVATRHLQRHPGTFAAAALSSPMHQPNARIIFSADSGCDWFKATGWVFSEAWAGARPSPYAHRPYDAQHNEYTHSALRWGQVLAVERAHPEVRLGGPTRGWARQACLASDAMIADAAQVTTPVLVLQAGEDTAVTPEGQHAFCDALRRGGRACQGGGPLRFAGARHELLIEADTYRVPALTAILDFFDQHAAAAR
ncbi:MAG: alpha/beta fold hydrolase [Rubrivivax sp.]